MDVSPEYIKMCDCPEIQHAKTYSGRGANSFHVRLPHPKLGDKMQMVTWLPRQDQIQEMLLEKFSKEVFVLYNTHNGSKLAYLIGVFKDFVHNKCEKMIPLENNRARIEYSFSSMEQLWLAFYMHEKHQKTWDDDKWKSTLK